MESEIQKKDAKLKKLETQLVSRAEVVVKKKEPQVKEAMKSTFGPNSKEDWPDHNIAIKALYD